MRTETVCPACGSSNISRRDDSKWLFNVKNEEELQNLKNTNRILLTLFDYPNFKDNDFSDIRIESFEIYPRNKRMIHFKEMLERHYRESYLPKIKDKGKANAMNFHPHKLDFYLCNPIKVFSAIIENLNTESPNISIKTYIPPDKDRTDLDSINMPISILNKEERMKLLGQAETILLDSGMVLPLYRSVASSVINLQEVGGWFVNAFDVHPLKYLYKKQPKLKADNVVMR
jgi:hypothetical protein